MPDAFTDLVREMRDAQKKYFKERTPSALVASKQLERRVDVAIKEIDDAALKQQDDAAHAGSDPQLAMDFDVI